MNPELRRNIWIELTPQRLVVPLLVLGLIYAGLSAGGTQARQAYGFVMIYSVSTCLWGARNAHDSVPGELRDHTWDGQRMSPISAWTMTWGKLLGSTIYQWYVGLLALAFSIFGFDGDASLLEETKTYISLLSFGIIAQSVAFSTGIENASIESRRGGKIGGLLVLLLFMGVFPSLMALDRYVIGHPGSQVVWFDQYFDPHNFTTVSLLIFAAWGVLGAYRMMRVELQYSNWPSVWSLFLIFLALFCGGFFWSADLSGMDKRLPEIPAPIARIVFLALLIFISTGWALLLTERKDLVRFRRAYLRVTDRGNPLEALPFIPKWLVSFVFACLALVLFWWVADQDGGELLTRSLTFGVSLLLLFLRDAGITLALHLSPRFRHRAMGGTFLALFVLYVVLPWFLFQIHLRSLSLGFLPSVETGVGNLIPQVIQAAAAIVLLAVRWTESMKELRA